MKQLTKFLLCTMAIAIMYSCTSKTDYESQIAQIKKIYQDSLTIMKEELSSAQKQIELLRYPADQRLQKAKDLIESGELDAARKEINQLKQIFPNSTEAASSSTLLSQIEKIDEAKRREAERIKALGFKALNTVQDVNIGNNKVHFSNFGIGIKFTHDVYPTYSGSAWREHTADKGSSYISYNMDVTSSSKDPNIPTIAFYSIDGDRLIRQRIFAVYFARWSDYGCYLGNEPDHKNDFAKVSTVKFRVGAQLENNYFKDPYVIVLKMANTLSREYDRYENPPVSYSGDEGYPYSLRMDDFKNGTYVALKVANL